MKTREQKEEEIKEIVDTVKRSDGFIVLGFMKVSADDLSAFRRIVREAGGRLRVVNRRLFRIALEKAGVDLEVEKKFLGQTSVLSFSGELFGIANSVYPFIKEHDLTIFDGFDMKENKVIEADYIKRIGQLPSREIVLGQVAGAIIAPLRALMYVLSAKAKGEGID